MGVNMNIHLLANQILILFLLMLVGFAARKKNLLNNELNAGFAEILLDITIPCMILTSFNLKFSSKILHNALLLFGSAVLVHIFSALLSLILYRKYPKPDRQILKFITIFSNTGFMGLPVLGSLYGPMGVFYGSIYVMVFNVFAWTMGVGIFTGKKGFNFKKVITNPAIIAVILGTIFFLLSVSLPVPLIKTMEMIGSMTTPLSMIIIGSMLADLKPREFFTGWSVYYGTVFRLLAIPLLAAYLLRYFGLSEHLLKICITSAAMPAATMTAIFAEKYNGNTILASRIVVITTALSLITIPIVVMLI
jgi:Predicted permeases